MEQPTSEPRACEVCGGRINQDNKYGICQRTAECRKIRARKKTGRTESRYCEACGRRLNSNNRSGVCNQPSPACLEARKQKRRKVNPKRKPPQRAVIHAGDVFGKLTALDEYDPKRRVILCRCECGIEKRVRRAHLAAGFVRSCGCLRYEVRRARKALYLKAGAVFGRLTAIEDIVSCNDRARFRCECGNEKMILAVSVKTGATKSCGCLTRTHGFSKHPLYSTWASMIQRCTNPNHNGHDNYSRLPKPVCDRWRDPWAFAEDILREIGPRPEARDKKGRVVYELDRIDNECGYGPGNVRWLDRKGQKANQRTIKGLTRERDAALARVAELEALL